MKDVNEAVQEQNGIGEIDYEAISEQIQEWKTKHKNIAELSVELGEGKEFHGIFKVPSEKDVELATRDDLKGREGQKELCRLCVLYPEPLAFNEVTSDYWGIVIPLAEQLLNLANVTKKARIKKL